MKKAKLTMACVYLLTVSVCVNAYAAETAESVIYVEKTAVSETDEIFESPAHFGTAEPPAEYEKNQSEAPAEDNDEAMNTPTIETQAPSESISVTHVPADSDGTKWWVFFSEPPAEYEKNQSEPPAEDSDVATRIISAENTNPSDGVTDGESDADAVTDGKTDADAVADGKSESNVNNEVQSGKVVAPKTGDAASSKTRLFVLAAMLGIAVVIACRSNRYVMKNE